MSGSYGSGRRDCISSLLFPSFPSSSAPFSSTISRDAGGMVEDAPAMGALISTAPHRSPAYPAAVPIEGLVGGASRSGPSSRNGTDLRAEPADGYNKGDARAGATTRLPELPVGGLQCGATRVWGSRSGVPQQGQRQATATTTTVATNRPASLRAASTRLRSTTAATEVDLCTSTSLPFAAQDASLAKGVVLADQVEPAGGVSPYNDRRPWERFSKGSWRCGSPRGGAAEKKHRAKTTGMVYTKGQGSGDRSGDANEGDVTADIGEGEPPQASVRGRYRDPNEKREDTLEDVLLPTIADITSCLEELPVDFDGTDDSEEGRGLVLDLRSAASGSSHSDNTACGGERAVTPCRLAALSRKSSFDEVCKQSARETGDDDGGGGRANHGEEGNALHRRQRRASLSSSEPPLGRVDQQTNWQGWRLSRFPERKEDAAAAVAAATAVVGTPLFLANPPAPPPPPPPPLFSHDGRCHTKEEERRNAGAADEEGSGPDKASASFFVPWPANGFPVNSLEVDRLAVAATATAVGPQPSSGMPPSSLSVYPPQQQQQQWQHLSFAAPGASAVAISPPNVSSASLLNSPSPLFMKTSSALRPTTSTQGPRPLSTESLSMLPSVHVSALEHGQGLSPPTSHRESWSPLQVSSGALPPSVTSGGFISPTQYAGVDHRTAVSLCMFPPPGSLLSSPISSPCYPYLVSPLRRDAPGVPRTVPCLLPSSRQLPTSTNAGVLLYSPPSVYLSGPRMVGSTAVAGGTVATAVEELPLDGKPLGSGILPLTPPSRATGGPSDTYATLATQDQRSGHLAVRRASDPHDGTTTTASASTAAATARTSEGPTRASRNLYFRNLPPSWNTSMLRELCSAYGAVRSAKVAHHPVTNESLSYGFVLFEEEQAAVRCLMSLNHVLLHTSEGKPRTLLVRMAHVTAAPSFEEGLSERAGDAAPLAARRITSPSASPIRGCAAATRLSASACKSDTTSSAVAATTAPAHGREDHPRRPQAPAAVLIAPESFVSSTPSSTPLPDDEPHPFVMMTSGDIAEWSLTSPRCSVDESWRSANTTVVTYPGIGDGSAAASWGSKGLRQQDSRKLDSACITGDPASPPTSPVPLPVPSQTPSGLSSGSHSITADLTSPNALRLPSAPLPPPPPPAPRTLPLPQQPYPPQPSPLPPAPLEMVFPYSSPPLPAGSVTATSLSTTVGGGFYFTTSSFLTPTSDTTALTSVPSVLLPQPLRLRSPPASAPAATATSTRNVYFTNLPLTWNTTRLRELCTPFGEIISAAVAHHPETNEPRGYGFVLFVDERDAAACVAALNHYHISNSPHVLSCRFAKDKATPSIAYASAATLSHRVDPPDAARAPSTDATGGDDGDTDSGGVLAVSAAFSASPFSAAEVGCSGEGKNVLAAIESPYPTPCGDGRGDDGKGRMLSSMLSQPVVHVPSDVLDILQQHVRARCCTHLAAPSYWSSDSDGGCDARQAATVETAAEDDVTTVTPPRTALVEAMMHSCVVYGTHVPVEGFREVQPLHSFKVSRPKAAMASPLDAAPAPTAAMVNADVTTLGARVGHPEDAPCSPPQTLSSEYEGAVVGRSTGKSQEAEVPPPAATVVCSYAISMHEPGEGHGAAQTAEWPEHGNTVSRQEASHRLDPMQSREEKPKRLKAPSPPTTTTTWGTSLWYTCTLFASPEAANTFLRAAAAARRPSSPAPSDGVAKVEPTAVWPVGLDVVPAGPLSPSMSSAVYALALADADKATANPCMRFGLRNRVVVRCDAPRGTRTGSSTAVALPDALTPFPALSSGSSSASPSAPAAVSGSTRRLLRWGAAEGPSSFLVQATGDTLAGAHGAAAPFPPQHPQPLLCQYLPPPPPLQGDTLSPPRMEHFSAGAAAAAAAPALRPSLPLAASHRAPPPMLGEVIPGAATVIQSPSPPLPIFAPNVSTSTHVRHLRPSGSSPPPPLAPLPHRSQAPIQTSALANAAPSASQPFFMKRAVTGPDSATRMTSVECADGIHSGGHPGMPLMAFPLGQFSSPR